MRSTYTINGQYVTHAGTCPWTGETFRRAYWCPTQGGYVRLDTTADESRPGTLGAQPHTDGVTWRAVDVADMLGQIKAAWRQEKRDARRAA